jgi:hypothetical protein
MIKITIAENNLFEYLRIQHVESTILSLYIGTCSPASIKQTCRQRYVYLDNPAILSSIVLPLSLRIYRLLITASRNTVARHVGIRCDDRHCI